VWRLVAAKVATLTEIDTAWSIDDIFDANAVLDYQQAARALANKGASN
jgi:hypothetical protein